MKPCKHCGKQFKPRRKTSKFCSQACNGASKRLRPDAICEHCSKQFKPKPGSKGIFCSKACYDAAVKISDQMECKWCGKVFTPSSRTNPEHTCSRECSDNVRRKTFARPCEECGVDFMPNPGQVNAKFCSVQCRDAARATKPKQCALCGKTFIPHHRNMRYCSRTCGGVARHTIHSHACEFCGSEFYPRSTFTAARFCSRNCQNLAQGWNSFSNSEYSIREQLGWLDKEGEISVADPTTGKHYYFDVKIAHNTVVELDYSGNHIMPIDSPKELRNYHLDKTLAAKRNGLHCVHAFPWDSLETLHSWAAERTHLAIANCEIVELDSSSKSPSRKDIRAFFDAYHFQGCGQKYGEKVFAAVHPTLGIVQMMMWGRPKFNKKFDWELYRSCTMHGYAVDGGIKALWDAALASSVRGKLISYCDIAKFSGASYETLGMVLARTNPPGYHWFGKVGRGNTDLHFTAAQMALKGFDRLVAPNLPQHEPGTVLGDRYHARMGKLGFTPAWDSNRKCWVFGKHTDNAELMEIHNFQGLFDCGQQVWTYECS